MSGLETAIRNALDRAERGDGQVRARIYQSARQALDAGLRKQGVTDNLVIMQQRKKLEEKIQEIESGEIDRLARTASPPLDAATGQPVEPIHDMSARPAPVFSDPSVVIMDAPAAPHGMSASSEPSADAGALGGVTRAEPAFGAAPGALSSDRRDIEEPAFDNLASHPVAGHAPVAVPDAAGRKGRKAKRGADAAKSDLSSQRAAKPRKRRGFLSHLVTWLVTLAVVAVGCWIFYSSGAVQSIIEDAVRAANRPGGAQSTGQGPSVISSRGGFSEEWMPIFEPREGAAFRAGNEAQAQIATGSEGQALRIVSTSPGAGGDVAIEVPAETLRELAGKSSTLAVTIQSAVNQPSQLSIRCEFGSLGTCSRHRFTATQEKQDALFRVTFEGKLAPNAPGRLVVNGGVGGTGQPVFIYSVRALPGQ